MDYNSMKKLASMMGEEFKVIDSVTLENINLQRLITKEKEYCANLETQLKKNDVEIEIAENETRRLKSKLEEVENSGLLLKTSLESLKSSHKMVDLLKVDLMKQLHLEFVKSSEQSMKFDSTIKKYEVMWESYKSTYQKFPLVADLHKSELKLKQKSIQLSIQETSVKVEEEKIKALSEILDKRYKVVVVKIAEKYLQRRKLVLGKNTLEKSIRLKEESLKIVKGDETRGQPLGILNSDGRKESFRKPRSFIMGSLEESNKENIYLPDDASISNSSKTSYQRYEAILAKRIHSVPLLKLPPLPLLDSPPRKVRSVGNLLSPPKTDWSKDSIDGQSVYGEDVKQLNASTPDISSHEQNSFKTDKEMVQNNTENKAENLNKKFPSNISMEATENEMASDDFQHENKYEMIMPEMEEDSKGKETEAMEVDEAPGDVRKAFEVEHLPKQSNELKAIPPLDSVEFSYEPRTEVKCPKMPETATVEMNSPYFVSSYLNFLEIPKNVEAPTEKANKPQKNTQSSGLDKNETVVIDLTDETEEQEIEDKENSDQKMQDALAKDEKVSEVSHIRRRRQDSEQALGMDVDSDNTPHNNTYIIDDVAGKPYEGTDDEGALMNNSSNYQSTTNEDQSYQFDVSQENQNMSFENQMEYSQISSIDSAEYVDASYASMSYASMSPDPSRVQSPLPASPNINNQDRLHLFGSPQVLQGFDYKFSENKQSSASALFSDSTPTKAETKERKQTEVFNFSFDTKRNTSTMFKLF